MKVGGNNISHSDSYFKEVFEKYFPVLCTFANKIILDSEIAKDLVQDVFIKVLDVNVDLEDEKALQAYLYVSTKNTCFSYLKKEKKYSFVESESVNLPTEKTILNDILQQETYRLLADAINDLSEQSQKIIKLSLSGVKNPEIADNLGISINTVKTHKLRAYKILREKLGYQFVTILLTQFLNIF